MTASATDIIVRLPWHRAASIAERAGSTPADVDRARSDRRLKRWRDMAAFVRCTESEFDERLHPLGITAGQLAALLGETDDSLRGRLQREPDWHRIFGQWWQAAKTVDQSILQIPADLGLLEIARPLLLGAAGQLADELRELLHNRDETVFGAEAGFVATLCSSLPISEVHALIERTLVLELNVARVEDRLDGATAQERFASFTTSLQNDATAVPIWDEYPVLARLVVTCLSHWVEARIEFARALASDLDAVCALLEDPPRRLLDIAFGAGDKHRRGRSVAFVHFDTGSLVFKPRSLAMDVAFDALLVWVNDKGLEHSLERTLVVDRHTHGWSAVVNRSVTTDSAGADRYAWRLGALCALLYMLHATDFHFENVVASGEQPVLVDLEALLHCDKTAAFVKVYGDEDVVAKTLALSVQSIGLIPNRMLVKGPDGLHGLDVSGLAGHGGQLTPMAVPMWQHSNTDEMHLVARRMEMDDEFNRPLDDGGRPMDLLSRSVQFRAGFCGAYRLLVEHKDELLGRSGPLTSFGEVHTRFIARPTHIYARLLMESTHPDFGRDALDQGRSLARLAGGLSRYPYGPDMVANEVGELLRGDIPTFEIHAADGTVTRGLDGRRIGTAEPPPLQAVLDRVRMMGERDLAFQDFIVQSSVAAASMGADAARWPNWRRPLRRAPLRTDRLVDAAVRIGRHLGDRCVEDADGLGWVGLELVGETYWQLTPGSMDTYTGLPGVAHALDAVARVSGDQRLRGLADRALEHVARRAGQMATELRHTPRKPDEGPISVGAFGPLSGPMYVLAHAAVQHQRADFASTAVSLVEAVDRLIDVDESLDVVAGCAGAILALLAVEQAVPGGPALEAARRAATRLVDTAVWTQDRCGWLAPLNPQVPLAGLSHGASGVAYSLWRLDQVERRSHYDAVIAGALRYERSVFDPAAGTWPDLRPEDSGGRTRLDAWCHGAAGIGLVRASMRTDRLALDVAHLLASDRDSAARAIWETGLGHNPVTGIGNHCLCHGDVGNLVVLQEIEGGLSERSEHVWSTLLDEAAERGWLCGVPLGVETPGLMTGLAGIAWGLVRAARPDVVPNLLSLEAPTHRGSSE